MTTGVITGVVLVFRDATEERAAENALQLADPQKGRVPRHPCALSCAIRWRPFARLRRLLPIPTRLPSRFAGALAVIERQTAHMARTCCDDLLDVSRITRGRLEVRRSRVRAAHILDAAVETARPAIDAGKHALTVSLPTGRSSRR